ncbi:MAG TPA: HypC/HybG/HupF family hydrogenase formation chaperone [Thermoplasmata archaeon]|nr:HypC/HybG/HupF family hydrogenase formation chaperone [Thermoplasmata archaeon]
MCLTVPGRIVRVDTSDPDAPVAQVDFGVAVKPVSLIYTPEAGVGSFVIVHAGFATQVIPESEALEAIEYSRQLSEVAAQEAASREAGEAVPLPEG